jgi:hypothetical protein
MGYNPKDTFFGKVLLGIDFVAFFIGFLTVLGLALFFLCYILGGILDGIADSIGRIAKHFYDIYHEENVFLMVTNGIAVAAILWLGIRWKFSREMIKTITKDFTKKR